MGLFSFIKNAGAKVFGIEKTKPEKAAESAVKKAKIASEKANKLTNAVEALEFDAMVIKKTSFNKWRFFNNFSN
mgnify:CR=1 FL=1|tara:strand:+ start:33757 stop:33978 length:222 start_codon:yes stop_codon:yes gene_type:complete